MKNYLGLILAFIIPFFSASAFNEKDYKAFAQDIRQQVWSSTLPEFKNPKHTDRFTNHSAVILAAYEEFSFDKSNEKISLFQFNGKGVVCNHLTRKMIQINDETALKKYSEFDFTAFGSERIPFYGKSEIRQVLGVRIIKPDGSTHVISTDEYILSTEGRKNKDGHQHLAVPGLAVGDIIDLFVYSYHNHFDLYIAPLAFFFVDQYPMLSYRVHCELDNELAIRYRTVNGAPDFTRTINDDNAYVLDVRVQNVEQTEPALWYRPSLQTPYTVIYMNNISSYNRPKFTMTRGLHDNPDAHHLFADAWDMWSSFMTGITKEDKVAIKEAKAKFQSQEERADYIYEHMVAYQLANRLVNFNDDYFIVRLSHCFKNAGIDYQCGMTTGEDYESMENLIDCWYVTRFLRLPNGKNYFPPTYACRPGEIPCEFQGRQAVVCSNPRHNLTEGPYAQIILPTSNAEDNAYHYDIKAQIEGTQMRINRISSFTGAMRQDVSLFMPTRDELVRSYSKKHEKMTSRSNLYKSKHANIVKEGDANDIKMQKEYFRDEIKAYHEDSPHEVGECHLLTVGTTDEEPALSFQSSYTMNNMVKRAGNNLILSVGQLLGSELKIEGRDRERTVDAIRIAPSYYTWDIEIALPEGYQVTPEALQSLQASYFNTCGSFTVKATVEDSKLHLIAKKRILHKRESAEKWPQLLALYDHSYNYNSQQIILKH